MEDIKYRYGFEADSSMVYAEWLYSDEKGKESRLFGRDIEQNIHYINKQKFKEGVGLKVPDNHLLIWKCDQNDGEISKKVLQWFKKIHLIDGSDSQGYFNSVLSQMKNDEVKPELLKLIKLADLGIDDIAIGRADHTHNVLSGSLFPEEFKRAILDSGGVTKEELQIFHKKFNAENQQISFMSLDLDNYESQGTKKFAILSALILDTLIHGEVLLIDEFDASLHPMLTECFVKLFSNKELNKQNAQLIFATHDIHLLSAPELFERDQIWFTEKDQYGSTNLYSLLEFRKKTKGTDVRSTDNLEKHYLQGRYGAVPYIGEL